MSATRARPRWGPIAVSSTSANSRERHGEAVRIVGFTTHTGTVTAASDWDAPARRREVRPSLPGSLERLLHDAGIERGALDLRGGALRDARLQRMIGVIYRPQTERQSHYLTARADEQFDALVHIDETTALQPLERLQPAARFDTVPSGI